MRCSLSVLSSPLKCSNPAHARISAANRGATSTRQCAHRVLTSEKSPTFARDSGMSADPQSVESGVRV